MTLLIHWPQVRVLALLAFAYLLASPATAQTVQAPAWQAAVAVGGANSSAVNAVAADSLGNMYMAGSFTGTARFGPFTLNSAGNFDGFIVKWSPTSNTFIWAQRWGGADEDAVADIAVRGSNIYITGKGTGPGVSIGNLPVLNCSRSDVIIAKLTDAGTNSNFVWAYNGGGNDGDVGQKIVVKATGLYIGGYSNSSVSQFGTLLTGNNGTASTCFIVKMIDMGSSAIFRWLSIVRGNNSDSINDLENGPGNSLYLSGATLSTTITFGASSLSFPVSNPIATNGFLVKLLDQDSTSNWSWAQGFGGQGPVPNRTYAQSVAVNGNNVYILGYYTGNTLQVGNITLTTFPAAIQKQDLFLTKLADAGTSASVVWAQGIGGNRLELPGDLLIDGSTLYMGGFFGSTVDFGGPTVTSVGRNDAFVAKLIDVGNSGRFIWAQQGGGNGDEYTRCMARRDTTIYIGGYFASSLGTTASFGPYTVTAAAVSTGTNAFGFGAVLGTNGRLVPTATRPEDLTAVALFPNPAHQTATLTLPAALAAQGAHVTLLNSLGQRVQQRTLLPHAPSLELNLAGLAAGVYSVQVRVGMQLYTKRLTTF